jgi:release factor glutamine methyltransferase
MYRPREDSFFLSQTLENYFKKKSQSKIKKQKFLDMGSGSGIQAETLANFTKKENITCIDIDPAVIKFLGKKGFNTVYSDLFSNIQEKFDFIIFNPPYLPEHEHDKILDTTGGKKGDETILRFLIQAKKHLNKDGKIILLISSHTPREKIFELLESEYKYKKIAEKKLFFEKLEIYEISL